MNLRRILIIEDDPDIAAVLRFDLTDAGFDVIHADAGMNGLIAAREQFPDLILLDLGLPDFDGSDVVQRLRKSSSVPIIVLTARDAPDETVRLLGMGADDYMLKPFHPQELLARIQVQFRQQAGEGPLVSGDLTLDRQKREAHYRDEALRLSAKEFELLAVLMSEPGRVFDRAMLNHEVWQGNLPSSSNVVDVHMSHLRNKLRDAEAYGLIRTVRGVGYAVRG